MKLVCWLVPWLLAMPAAAPVAAETRALVVAGLGGEPGYEAEFQRQAAGSADQLRQVAEDVTVLTGAAAQRDRLERELTAVGSRSGEADQVVVMLIGHGTFDDRDYRFNVPGPDVSGDDLSRWLDALPVPRQLVVVATSSSGALQPLLASESRTVVTATKSGGERNVTVFPRYFARALTDSAADTDKDGRVSAIEAFRFAENGVTAHYRERGQMVAEHPTLEGPEPTVALARLGGVPAFDPGTVAERRRTEELEAAIAELRADKDNLEPEAYYAELQRLLLEIAMLRRRGDQGPGS